MTTQTRVRRLTSLCPTAPNSQSWCFRYAYYLIDEHGGLRWTGEYEECTLTEDELYELLKLKLEGGRQ